MACKAYRNEARDAKLNGAVILWVDDHPENNLFERQALIEMGVRIISVTNTQTALDELRRRPFDAIISDFTRSDDPKGGYTLLEKLPKRPTHPPYIIYSGSFSSTFSDEAKSKGALGETNEPSDLFKLVIKAIKMRRASTE